MLKFTSVSGSIRAITDITLTVTIIRTGITITGRTTGTADIVIIATIITGIIIGANLIRIATPSWLEAVSGQPNFFSGNSLRRRHARDKGAAYFDFGEPAGLVAGLLPGSSSWNSFLNC